jgi:four helix bundle protein
VPAVRSHRDLLVWQKAIVLVECIYRVTESFPPEERYGLISQLRRAAISIPANIAEGHGRSTRGEFANHLSIARGSLKEVESLLEIAMRLGMLNDRAYRELNAQCDEISRMLTALKRAITR